MQRDGSISITQRWICRLRCHSIYDIYQRICSVTKDGSKKINEFYVIQILLYVENMGHLKLDGVYAQLYRRSEDMVGHWCGLMELSAPTVNAVKMIVGDGYEVVRHCHTTHPTGEKPL